MAPGGSGSAVNARTMRRRATAAARSSEDLRASLARSSAMAQPKPTSESPRLASMPLKNAVTSAEMASGFRLSWSNTSGCEPLPVARKVRSS